MLAQKLAVVTGAARGIGLAVARDLAAAGCMVLMVGRGAEAIEDAARQLRESGHEVLPHVADVTDASAVAALGARLRREFGRADILVNNAGVFLEAADFRGSAGSQRFRGRSGTGGGDARLQRARAAATDSGASYP
jgi:NADP-dependent 3-hydroxy acid dehydrogenase YdfG